MSLSGSTPVSPAYDANGNLTSDGTWTFGYDAENRLTSASRTSPTVVNAAYAYDVLGRRAAKTVDSITTLYVSDGNQEIAEYDGGSGTLLRRFVYGVGIDEPLVQITRSGLKFYYRADALGSIVAAEEHSSGFLQRYGYGPFGETTSATGHPYRYTGRRLDDETGLYYYRARMYSVNLGRFLQSDPIGYSGGINLYAYVSNDPLNLVDPMGTTSEPPGAFQRALTAVGDWLSAPGTVPTGRPLCTSFSMCMQATKHYGEVITVAPYSRGEILDVLLIPGGAVAKAGLGLIKGGSAVAKAGGLADDIIVVRGGISEVPPPGQVFSGAYGTTLEEAASGVAHGQIRATTAGQIRAGGGTVDVAPELTRGGVLNERHVNICLGNGACPFEPIQTNPVPKAGRIK